MLQTMINGSLAVLRQPSVPTFEEHEQDNLGWATIYVAIGAVIAGILGVIASVVQGPQPGQAEVGPISAVIINLMGTLVGFFIFLGVVLLLGRAFGGTGRFGELAYDISLFWTPLAVLVALIDILSIGLLGLFTGLVTLVIGAYNFYLTYLGIQSGMNLPSNKALYVILILLGIGLVLFVCGVVVLIFAAAATEGVQ